MGYHLASKALYPLPLTGRVMAGGTLLGMQEASLLLGSTLPCNLCSKALHGARLMQVSS